jgi:5-hydroxyisourate hydrolase
MITTHILDLSRGAAAAHVPVTLEVLSSGTAAHGQWKQLGQSATNTDGRIKDFLPSGSKPEKGTYRLVFDTNAYFGAQNMTSFYPNVTVVFLLSNPDQHHHIPLLLSPFGYSTYRGT